MSSTAVASGVAMPSTLGYRERLALKSDDSNGYAKLYSFQHGNVYRRLTADATTRQQLRSVQPPEQRSMAWPAYHPSSLTFYSKGTLSGFVTNTSNAVYTHSTFRTGHHDHGHAADLNSMSAMRLKRYKAREPFDYAAQIRPDAETTNQSMRMMGTYESDFAAARRANLFIPNVCPGGAPYFHPDIRVQNPLTGTAAHFFTTHPHTMLGRGRTV